MFLYVCLGHFGAADPWDPMSQHVEQDDTLDYRAAERTPPCGLSTSHPDEERI
jgi:hypothetical protein